MGRKQRQKHGDLLGAGSQQWRWCSILNVFNKNPIEFSDGQDVEYKQEESRTA